MTDGPFVLINSSPRSLSELIGPASNKLPVTLAAWRLAPATPTKFETGEGTVWLISHELLDTLKSDAEADDVAALGGRRLQTVYSAEFLGVPVVDLDGQGEAVERCKRIMCNAIEANFGNYLLAGALRFPAKNGG